MKKDFLPKLITWFRLDEHVRRLKQLVDSLTIRIETLEEAPTSSEPNYKIYTALLTQSGTNAPVATVLENTIGNTVTYVYNNPGRYTVQLENEINVNLSSIQIESTCPFDGILVRVSEITSTSFAINVIEIQTDGVSIQTPGIDSALIGTPLQIKVYN